MSKYLDKFCHLTGLEKNETELMPKIDFVKNKYYTGIICTDFIICSGIKRMVKRKKEKINRALKKGDLVKALMMYERPFRLQELMDLNLDNFEPEKVGEVIRYVWTDSENPHVNNFVWRTLFEEFRGYLMSKQDQKEYNALPDKFIIYRGTTNPLAEEDDFYKPLSWTLNEKIAEKFSVRFDQQDAGRVLKREIKKTDAAALFLNRGEQEIIYFPKQ